MALSLKAREGGRLEGGCIGMPGEPWRCLMCGVLFTAGFNVGGAADHKCSFVSWIYHGACQPQYWVSEGGPPHDEGPYVPIEATHNVFARMVPDEERLPFFYGQCKMMPHTGDQDILVDVG